MYMYISCTCTLDIEREPAIRRELAIKWHGPPCYNWSSWTAWCNTHDFTRKRWWVTAYGTLRGLSTLVILCIIRYCTWENNKYEGLLYYVLYGIIIYYVFYYYYVLSYPAFQCAGRALVMHVWCSHDSLPALDHVISIWVSWGWSMRTIWTP